MSAFGFSSVPLRDALVDYADELEEAEEGTGVAWLVAYRDAAMAAVMGDPAGGASQFISSSVNGQSFTKNIALSNADMLATVSEALKQVKGNALPVTYFGISNIPH